MRFHPKRRESTDQRPGPNIARAPPMVASKRGTHGSPARVNMIWPIAVKATSVPAMGVHRPGMRRAPDPINNAAVIVASRAGLLPSVEHARKTSAEPPTRRMRSNPMPGQPPAKVEYSRRKGTPFTRSDSHFAAARRNPKKSRNRPSLET